MITYKDFMEARMSAAVKLQRALERERVKSEASRRRGEEVMAQAKAETEKKMKEVKEETTPYWKKPSFNKRMSALAKQERLAREKKEKEKQQPVKEEAEKHHVLAFGRMNPPTAGHEQVVNKVHEVAKEHNAGHSVVLSHSHDAKKNPLPVEKKVEHAKNAFPGTNVHGASKEKPTILHHAADLHKAGVHHLHVVAGSDRKEEMHNLLHKYNGQKAAHGHYNFKSITVHSSGDRDPDSEGTSGVSGTKMREHAASGNKKEFHKHLPSQMKPEHKEKLYNDLRSHMGIHEETLEQQADRVKQLRSFKDQVKKLGMSKKEVDALRKVQEGAYEKSEENKRSADSAKAQGDMFAHHLHMSDYHDNLSQWHGEKGRHGEADKHAAKAEEHHEKAMSLKEAATTGNPGSGYQGQHSVANNSEEAYANFHAVVKALTDGDDKTVKHYLDSGHGKGLVGREEDHDYIKKDFKKFMKYYRPTMHEKPKVNEGTLQPSGDDKIETSTSAPTASTAKDTTMAKTIKGFKFFKGENDKQMQVMQPVKENAPVAPVPDKKYIKGTPEWKAHKEAQKPRTGHPTNVKEESDQIDEALDPSEIASNPKMYSADSAKKAYYHKNATPEDKKSLERHLDRHHGGTSWRKPVKEETDQIDEVAPPGFEGTVKAMKKHKEIDNPWALAWWMKNKGMKSHRKVDGSMKEAFINGREYASQGVMHPDHAKNHKVGAAMDFYGNGTGDKLSGKVTKNTGKEVHIQADKMSGGKLHKFNVTPHLPKPVNEAKKNKKPEWLLKAELAAEKREGKNVQEAQYAGLEKEDKPGKIKTEMGGSANAAKGETVEGWKDTKKVKKEETMKTFKDFVNDLHEIKMADLPSRKIQGKSYGANYEDPEGADDAWEKEKSAKAGRKSGQRTGVYKPRKTMSKLKQAGSIYK